MTNRNVLRCVECGTVVLTEARSRECYKCGSVMKFEGKEFEFKKERRENEKENNI